VTDASERAAPFLSMALAVYQRWEELKQVLDALLPQLDADTELVISDNGSPNGMADKCEAMCAGYPNVRLIRQPVNVGAGLNYLATFQASRGDFVICMADDDVPSPHFVSFVKDAIRANPDIGIFHFEPNPVPGRAVSRRVCGPGLDAVLSIFAYSGMMPGIAFARRLFREQLWPPAPAIYPQVLLSATLARQNGSVLTTGPEGLFLGGEADTAVKRARSRPTDFGIGERLSYLARIVRSEPRTEYLRIMNGGVHDLTAWAWTVFNEMWCEDPRQARTFMAALTAIDHVYSSPYMLLTWLHSLRRIPSLRHSLPYVLPALVRGFVTTRYWATILHWKETKLRRAAA
jgi:glycosyltransferase involved in cell wall biosynthesis